MGSDRFAGTKMLKTIRYKFKSHSPCHLVLSKQKEKQNGMLHTAGKLSFVAAVLILIQTKIFSLNSTKSFDHNFIYVTTSVLYDKGSVHLLLVPCNSRIYRGYVGFGSFGTYSVIWVWGLLRVATGHWVLRDMSVIPQLTLARCLLQQRPRLTLRKVWLLRWQWRCQIAKKNWDCKSQVYVIISLCTSHTKYRLLWAWLVQLVCADDVFQTPKERHTHLMKHTSPMADILSIKDGKISVYFTNLKCI